MFVLCVHADFKGGGGGGRALVDDVRVCALAWCFFCLFLVFVCYVRADARDGNMMGRERWWHGACEFFSTLVCRFCLSGFACLLAYVGGIMT